jgi:hypothetical protein
LDRPGDGGFAGPEELAQQGVGEGTALVERIVVRIRSGSVQSS